jgi:hypothetical protein
MEDKYSYFKSKFNDIPGFCADQSIFIWDFLFQAQDSLGVQGDFFEIGVYKGKTAVLGALYLRPEDSCVLVDIYPMPEAAAYIESFRTKRNKYLCRSSINAGEAMEVREHFGRCRWVHIDGDHKGATVKNDLELAVKLIQEKGVICVDDFFNFRYPQITAATYKFLFDYDPQFRIFFAGALKCYICRGESVFAAYDGIIRDSLCKAMDSREISDQINRTSYASDYGCFTIGWREGERRFCGMDDNLDKVVF